jgi:hypothetical protein
MRVHLDNSGIQISGEGGHAWHLVICHRDNYILGFEALLPRTHDKPAPILPKPVNRDVVSHGQSKMASVLYKIVGHLFFGGKTVAPDGEAHPWKSRVPRGGKQSERIPAVAPRISDPRVGVQDQERKATPRQMVSDGKPRLAATDNNSLNLLCVVTAVHSFTSLKVGLASARPLTR